VKSIVDEDLSRGQYLLTGSTRFLTVPSISESLAGRAGIVDLWPYTQGEIELLGDAADNFLEWLLTPAVPLRQLEGERPSRDEYLARVCVGGFPEVQQLASAVQRRRWFDGYIRTVTSRDVPGISRAQHIGELPKLLGALAAMTGQQLVVSQLAEKVALARQTVDATYLPLLETVFLAIGCPPGRGTCWRASPGIRSLTWLIAESPRTCCGSMSARWQTPCARPLGPSWRPSWSMSSSGRSRSARRGCSCRTTGLTTAPRWT
jgi:predicted AAA+ superfamily ATPase